MKIEIYQKAAQRTLPSLGEKYLNIGILGLKLDLAHMALGIASEMSELEECLIQNHKKLDLVNLGEELGDKMWYAVNWANLLNIQLEDCDIENQGEASSSLVIYGGQLADIAKRFLAYGATLEQQEEKRSKSENYLSNKEILLRYIAAIYEVASIYDLDIETIMGKNITKLYIRYPDKFSEDSALIRDLEAERKVLENNE